VFLGWSYGSMNQILMQYLYYLTLCGLGIWFLYRLFTLNKAINEYNVSVANSLGFDLSERATLGAIL
jgi:ABC-type Fe3+-siderophore transport system permease subunit